ncbi:MAG: hypothetical protein HOD90_10260 [Nitrospina sp.]|jgi:hypothetical protein|nr:hypothetical protein [Nitrospina sp.]
MNAAIDNEKNVDVDDYFLLAARVWNSKTEDYPSIEDSATSQKYFNNFPDAEQSFQNSDSFPELKGKDIKLDLIHVRYGVNRFLLSRIVI